MIFSGAEYTECKLRITVMVVCDFSSAENCNAGGSYDRTRNLDTAVGFRRHCYRVSIVDIRDSIRNHRGTYILLLEALFTVCTRIMLAHLKSLQIPTFYYTSLL
jgi:hypothetical protein